MITVNMYYCKRTRLGKVFFILKKIYSNLDFISLIVFIYFFSRVFCYVNSFDITESKMHLKHRTTKLLTSISHHQLLVRDHNKKKMK
jgi:hypothetical protein